MVESSIHDFVLSIIGASATFIGLLFVAISFVINDTKLNAAQYKTKRLLAEISFISLLNIFFLGLIALIPKTSISPELAIFGAIGLIRSIRFSMREDHGQHWARLLVALGTYLLELGYGIYALFQNNSFYLSNSVFTVLIILLFVVSISRAWDLTGIKNL